MPHVHKQLNKKAEGLSVLGSKRLSAESALLRTQVSPQTVDRPAIVDSKSMCSKTKR